MFTWAILVSAALTLQAPPDKAIATAPLPPDSSKVNVSIRMVEGAVIAPRLPVLVEIKVTNTTGEDADIPAPTLSSREEVFNTLDLLYARDAAIPLNRIRFATPDFSPYKENATHEPPALMRLAPGESWSARVPVSHDWDVDVPRPLTRAGVLVLQARLCALEWDADAKSWRVDRENGRLSNRLEIEIPKSAGADATILRALERRPRPWLLANPAALDDLIDDDGIYNFCDKLVRTRPASIYSLYAEAALAHMTAWGDRSITAGSAARQPDWPGAIEMATKLAKDNRIAIQDDLRDLVKRIEARQKMAAESAAAPAKDDGSTGKQ